MLKFALALGLAALLVGSAVAVTDPNTTVITGNLSGCSVGLLVPQNTNIPLERGSNNEMFLGTVTVIGCDQCWDFRIVSDTPAMHIVGNSSQQLPQDFQIAWREVGTGPWSEYANVDDFAAHYFVGCGSKSFEFYVRQPVGTSDPGGNYTISLSYQMFADPPGHPT